MRYLDSLHNTKIANRFFPFKEENTNSLTCFLCNNFINTTNQDAIVNDYQYLIRRLTIFHTARVYTRSYTNMNTGLCVFSCEDMSLRPKKKRIPTSIEVGSAYLRVVSTEVELNWTSMCRKNQVHYRYQPCVSKIRKQSQWKRLHKMYISKGKIAMRIFLRIDEW